MWGRPYYLSFPSLSYFHRNLSLVGRIDDRSSQQSVCETHEKKKRSGRIRVCRRMPSNLFTLFLSLIKNDLSWFLASVSFGCAELDRSALQLHKADRKKQTSCCSSTLDLDSMLCQSRDSSNWVWTVNMFRWTLARVAPFSSVESSRRL